MRTYDAGGICVGRQHDISRSGVHVVCKRGTHLDASRLRLFPGPRLDFDLWHVLWDGYRSTRKASRE